MADQKGNPQELHRIHIVVMGRVQNVGFRAHVHQAGYQLNLTGWVRNISYDQVEAVAEGTQPALEEFAQIVLAGPRGSRVEDSDVKWETYTGEFSSFSVRSSR